MQTFGSRVAVAFRKSKSAPWIEARCRTLPVMCMVGGLKVSCVPSSRRKAAVKPASLTSTPSSRSRKSTWK